MPSPILISSAILIALYMTMVFIVACIKQDNGVVDIAWGIGFILVALTSFLQSVYAPRQVLATILVILWGLRLSMHICIRNWRKEEDFRYKNMRETWGNMWLIRSFAQIYIPQGIVMLLMSLPILLINTAGTSALTNLDFIGTAVFSIGFLLESIADFQLLAFKRQKKNKGRILMEGLWKWSRHPNYFGETLVWLGIFLLALGVPGGILTIVSPLLITILLLRVSGVPMLEERYRKSTSYQDYCKRTSGFVPWFSKQH